MRDATPVSSKRVDSGDDVLREALPLGSRELTSSRLSSMTSEAETRDASMVPVLALKPKRLSSVEFTLEWDKGEAEPPVGGLQRRKSVSELKRAWESKSVPEAKSADARTDRRPALRSAQSEGLVRDV
uniref:Uncharacterized protein n=3 Tax=Chrysotila carterae TaxID=13221 RepID=A0A7S4F680_CHRCT